MTIRVFDVYLAYSGLTGNPAINTFHLDSANGQTDAQIAAQLIAFEGYGSKAILTSIEGIRTGTVGGSGMFPVPFPMTEYNVLRSHDALIATLTGYGDAAIGNGNITPLGTSITLSLYSLLPGRHRTGRLYMPYISVGSVVNANGGSLLPVAKTQIEQAYLTYLRGVTGLPGVAVLPPDLLPQVHSTTGDFPIITPVASPTLSNLRSRRR